MFFTLKFHNCTRCVEPIEHLKKCTRCVEPFQIQIGNIVLKCALIWKLCACRTVISFVRHCYSQMHHQARHIWWEWSYQSATAPFSTCSGWSRDAVAVQHLPCSCFYCLWGYPVLFSSWIRYHLAPFGSVLPQNEWPVWPLSERRSATLCWPVKLHRMISRARVFHISMKRIDRDHTSSNPPLLWRFHRSLWWRHRRYARSSDKRSTSGPSPTQSQY